MLYIHNKIQRRIFVEEENKLNENNAEEEINVCRGIPSVGAKSGAVGLNSFAVIRNYEQNGGEHKNERTNQGNRQYYDAYAQQYFSTQ